MPVAKGKAPVPPSICTWGLNLGAEFTVGPSFLQSCTPVLPGHVTRSQWGTVCWSAPRARGGDLHVPALPGPPPTSPISGENE